MSTLGNSVSANPDIEEVGEEGDKSKEKNMGSLFLLVLGRVNMRKIGECAIK